MAALDALPSEAIGAILWVIYCRKMKRVNEHEQYRDVMSNETYTKILADLEQISHMDELTKLYAQKVREYPSIEKFLTKTYNKRKAELVPSEVQ